MVSEMLSKLSHYLHLHPMVGLYFAFFSAFIESLAIIGSLIPGSLTMTLVGSLIGSGVLPFKLTLFIVFFGAYIGDCLSYAVGFRYQTALLNHPRLLKYEHWIKQGEHFIKKHGGKGIIIGRFFGPFRSMVPLIAGILSMRVSLFLAAAFISAWLWALVYLFPGLMIGSFALELNRSGGLAFIAKTLLFILFLWFVYYVCVQLNRLSMRLIDFYAENIKCFFKNHLIMNKILCKSSIEHFKAQISYLFSSILGFSGFLWIGHQVTTQGWFTDLNYPLTHLMHSLHTPFLTHFFADVSLFVDYNVCYAWFAFFSFYLLWKREWWYLFIWTLLSMGFGYQFVHLLKNLYHNLRPEYVLHITRSFSYPSGHTASSIIFFGFWLLHPEHSEKNTFSWLRTTTLIALCSIAFSRVFLGFHWLTDVIGGAFYGYGTIYLGYFLGGFINHSLFSKENIKKHYRPGNPLKHYDKSTNFFVKNEHIKVALMISLLFFIIACVRYFPRQMNIDKTPKIQHIQKTQWQNQTGLKIAIIRQNRLGQDIAPFNIQWLGSLSKIETTLSQLGWKKHDVHINVWSRLLHLFHNRNQHFHPLFPPLYNNKPAILFMSYLKGKKYWIMRLWYSNIEVDSKPLWVGTLLDNPIPGRILKHKRRTSSKFNAEWLKKSLKNNSVIFKNQPIYPLKNWPKNLVLIH
jgi:membrane protein DedA with SNARE-associated domain/membrane-associated phospholipid phosphatase